MLGAHPAKQLKTHAFWSSATRKNHFEPPPQLLILLSFLHSASAPECIFEVLFKCMWGQWWNAIPHQVCSAPVHFWQVLFKCVCGQWWNCIPHQVYCLRQYNFCKYKIKLAGGIGGMQFHIKCTPVQKWQVLFKRNWGQWWHAMPLQVYSAHGTDYKFNVQKNNINWSYSRHKHCVTSSHCWVCGTIVVSSCDIARMYKNKALIP